jgi:predicted ATPase with chaperone activity
MATVIRLIGIEGIKGYPIAVQVKLLAGVSVMNIVGLGKSMIAKHIPTILPDLSEEDHENGFGI